MIPMVISRLTISLLSTKFSQDLTFVIRMSGAVNKTGFWFALQSIYISFLVLSGALYRLRVSLRRGGLYSLILAVTSTIGIFHCSFFIRRFYYTFVDRFCDLRTLKHVNSLFKWNGFARKDLNIGLFRPAIRHPV